MEIRVDPKFHSKLIGSRGASINKLRQDFDVDVQFPRSNDAPEDADRIVLIGMEKQANAARDKITALIAELVSGDFQNLRLHHLNDQNKYYKQINETEK